MPEETHGTDWHESDEEVRAIADELTGLLQRLLVRAAEIDTKGEPVDRLLSAAVLVRRAWHALGDADAAREEQRDVPGASSQTQTDPDPGMPDPDPPDPFDGRRRGHGAPMVCVHVRR